MASYFERSGWTLYFRIEIKERYLTDGVIQKLSGFNTTETGTLIL